MERNESCKTINDGSLIKTTSHELMLPIKNENQKDEYAFSGIFIFLFVLNEANS